MRNLILTTFALILRTVTGSSCAHAQIGIGTKLPQAKLHVYDGTFLSQTPALDPQNSPFYDPANSDDDPVHHAFKWIHEKSAFRTLGASIYGLTLDAATVGRYSFASGFDAAATGTAATALGMRSNASGLGGLASGQFAVAYGSLSLAQGQFATSDGPNCVTMGTNLSNNYQSGAFIFGHAGNNAQSTGNNQIRMFFEGGYRLFSNDDLTAGVLMNAGGNAWNIVSDARKKENFEAADEQKILQKIASLPLSSWNYKSQETGKNRHYGPMAQDFFKAFGQDSFGVIGSDTTINQADLDGVTLMAIQALIRETDELQKVNDALQLQLMNLRKRVSDLPATRHMSLADRRK